MLTNMKKSTKAESDVTRSRNVSSKPLRLYLGAFLLRMAGQITLLTGKHSESFRS